MSRVNKNMILLTKIDKNKKLVKEKKYILLSNNEESFITSYKNFNLSSGLNYTSDINLSKIKPRVAILLTGLHYVKNFNHWSNKKFDIDFRQYYKNIKDTIYDYFCDNYEIDTFISTNSSIMFDELLKYYKPVNYVISNGNKLEKTRKALEILEIHMNETGKNYNYICITRFDIYFINKLFNLNLNKLNLTYNNKKDNEYIVDDNFYLFPFDYLKNFISCLHLLPDKNDRRCMHFLLNLFERNMEINYIVDIKNKDFVYKFNLFSRFEYSFILNKYTFTDNIEYNIDNNILVINENTIKFKTSIENNQNSLFGFIIKNKGDYKITYTILTDKDILGNYVFLNSVIETDNIEKEIECQVSLNIKTESENELFAFNFRDYPNLNVIVSNLSLV